LCGENGIDGDGEHSGNNDAKLGRIDVLYLEAPGGNYVPCAVLFYLGPCVIDGIRASALMPRLPREPKRGRGHQLGQGPLH
jgi:hypothetical protein